MDRPPETCHGLKGVEWPRRSEVAHCLCLTLERVYKVYKCGYAQPAFAYLDDIAPRWSSLHLFCPFIAMHFFGIQDIANHLALYLTQSDLARLCRVSRSLHAAFLPLTWRTLDLTPGVNLSNHGHLVRHLSIPEWYPLRDKVLEHIQDIVQNCRQLVSLTSPDTSTSGPTWLLLRHAFAMDHPRKDPLPRLYLSSLGYLEAYLTHDDSEVFFSALFGTVDLVEDRDEKGPWHHLSTVKISTESNGRPQERVSLGRFLDVFPKCQTLALKGMLIMDNDPTAMDPTGPPHPLIDLSLSRCRIDVFSFVKQLPRLAKVKHLAFGHGLYPVPYMVLLAQSCSELVSYTHEGQFSKAAFPELAQFFKSGLLLQELVIRYPPMDDAMIEVIAKHCGGTLKRVCVPSSLDLTSRGLTVLMQSSLRLTCLNVVGSNRVPMDFMGASVLSWACLDSLEEIVLAPLERTTKERCDTIRVLLRRLSRLRKLSITGENVGINIILDTSSGDRNQDHIYEGLQEFDIQRLGTRLNVEHTQRLVRILPRVDSLARMTPFFDTEALAWLKDNRPDLGFKYARTS